MLVLALAACGREEPKLESTVHADPASGSDNDPTTEPPDPRDQRCEEPCLFLLDTPLDRHADAYRTACGKPLLPDNADCGKLDYWRNCIYAAHGLRFRKKKWQVYATKPWYRPDPNFDSKILTPLERANVHELRLRARVCRHNDVHVSTADHARIQAWFAAYAKGAATFPATTLSGDDALSQDEMRAALAELAPTLTGETWMAYHDADAAVVAAHPTKKLRCAIVDLPTADSYLHFVYDDTDAHVGLVLTDH